MKTDPQRLVELHQLIKETPGDFTFWPTHFAGCVPFVEASGKAGHLQFQVQGVDQFGPVAKADMAIGYARRLAASANELPNLLDDLAALQEENARLREARDGVAKFLLQYWRGELPFETAPLDEIEATLKKAEVNTEDE